MKKLGYIAIGIVIGSIMSFSVGAAADSISLIGKKIGGESDVIVNGAKIGTAIIVNGSSYAPVRVIGEAAGFNVGFVDKKVVLGTTKQEGGKTVEQPVVDDKTNKLIQINGKIQQKKGEIGLKEALLNHGSEAQKPPQSEIDALYAELAELEKQKAELEK